MIRLKKEIEIILQEILLDLEIRNNITKLSSIDDTFEDNKETYSKYKKYTIEDIISLYRIEKLYENNSITSEEKEKLTKLFKDYLILNNVISSSELEVLFNESTICLSKEDYHEMIEKREQIRNTLDKYGILDKFNYEEAFTNQIKKELKHKKLTKKKNSN